MSQVDGTGVIHDIGYQRYRGPRLGRGYAARSLYVHGLRTAFGLGRSAKAKIFPWLVVGLALMVAVVAVVVRSQTNEVAIGYLDFSDDVAVPMLLFLAVVAPELVSRDLRAHVLPLYFSRPMSRADYALAKLAAMVSAAWLLLAAPLLLMFIGGLFSQTNGLSGAWHESGLFLRGLGYAAFYALILPSLAVLIASLASRRAVAAAAIVGVFLATAPVVAVLQEIGSHTVHEIAPILNPVTLVNQLGRYVFHTKPGEVLSYGPLYIAVAVLLLAGCVTLLVARYRKVSE